MQTITTLFCDVGGVILTNGWDFPSRRKAAQKFGFDLDDFEARHARFEEDLETGRISLDEYIEESLFFKPRSFKAQELKAFMFSLSEENSPAMAILSRLKNSQRYQMAALNNESLELNLYRIEKFHLREYFSNFFSSSFLGLRKPGREIYDKVLQITQREPAECLFIDDRMQNLEQAEVLGISTIHYQNAGQLQQELQLRLGA
jgi:putative hydrolase of the HAD superfamily